jgi:hypothetical protein
MTKISKAFYFWIFVSTFLLRFCYGVVADIVPLFAVFLCHMMELLNIPPVDFRIKHMDDKVLIYDVFRKAYVVLTPEEWVRQHFLSWLVCEFSYPAGLIAVEVALKYNRMTKRADAVVYDKNLQPLMLIECKAPGVKITQRTFEQAARYNYVFKTPYLAFSNGMEHFCCRFNAQEEKLCFLETVPHYHELISQQ